MQVFPNLCIVQWNLNLEFHRILIGIWIMMPILCWLRKICSGLGRIKLALLLIVRSCRNSCWVKFIFVGFCINCWSGFRGNWTLTSTKSSQRWNKWCQGQYSKDWTKYKHYNSSTHPKANNTNKQATSPKSSK